METGYDKDSCWEEGLDNLSITFCLVSGDKFVDLYFTLTTKSISFGL
jgi:hypothetical protein